MGYIHPDTAIWRIVDGSPRFLDYNGGEKINILLQMTVWAMPFETGLILWPGSVDSVS